MKKTILLLLLAVCGGSVYSQFYTVEKVIPNIYDKKMKQKEANLYLSNGRCVRCFDCGGWFWADHYKGVPLSYTNVDVTANYPVGTLVYQKGSILEVVTLIKMQPLIVKKVSISRKSCLQMSSAML